MSAFIAPLNSFHTDASRPISSNRYRYDMTAWNEVVRPGDQRASNQLRAKEAVMTVQKPWVHRGIEVHSMVNHRR